MEKVGYPKHLGKNDRRETKRNTKKTKNGAQPPPYVQGMAFWQLLCNSHWQNIID